ncbi:MAG TPA: cytochrome c3 family protein [Chthonomonadaceae bacterium]|nr:cytochrome c3 family protein [Chthonomonadaceae bacterium]
MARPFPPYTNTLSRVIVFGLFVSPILIGWIATAINWSPYINETNIPRNQPVPFSHKHHVGGLGLDCRYCHTTVETTSFANIPPIHTCMTCHSQIWKDSPMLAPIRDSYASDIPVQWTRVNFVPDFVYFNHSIHVNKGIGCETCHGRVDEMPLTARGQPLMMAWCLNCHRNPERYVRPREDVFIMGYQPPENQLTLGRQLVQQYHIRKLQDCYTCHR